VSCIKILRFFFAFLRAPRLPACAPDFYNLTSSAAIGTAVFSAAPERWTYSDIAIAPAQADEFEALDLYRATSGGEAAPARKRRDDAIIAGAGTAARALDPA
jgi:hypothetical protein